MPQEFPTIYRAKNLQEAYLLKDVLEEEGIHATVSNEILQGGSGVDIVGWPTLPQLLVSENDAARAREIVMKFDDSSSVGLTPHDRQPVDIENEVVDEWPCCPECGEPRSTRCTFCGTSGIDFPPADANAGDLPEMPSDRAEDASHCNCGHGGCGNHGGDCEEESPEEVSLPPLVICPTCDEPFQPRYARRCQNCGYEFSDGVDWTPHKEHPPESFNWRIAYVFYALAVLAIGLVAYLLTLF
jgi:ribosomal protein L37AE/L43A